MKAQTAVAEMLLPKFYENICKMRFLNLMKLRYPKAFLLRTLILLLQPSVKPLVYGVSKELRIPENQENMVFAHFWNDVILELLAQSIHFIQCSLASSRSLQSSILRKPSFKK